MADLLAYHDSTERPNERLRLVIQWRSIITDHAIAWDLAGEYSIGLFIGERPLFAEIVYDGTAPITKSQPEGCFHGESDGCEILHDLKRVLLTGDTVVFEDIIEPWVKLVIGGDIFNHRKKKSGLEPPEYFEVLAIIQYGGPWQEVGMGGSGPAMMMEVERSALEAFFQDLVREAVDPSVCNDVAQGQLQSMFADVFAETPR